MLRSVLTAIVLLLFFTSFKNSPLPVKNTRFNLHYLSVVAFYNNALKSSAEEIAKPAEADNYSLMGLDKKGLSKYVFDLAMKGYNKLVEKKLIRNKSILSIADFSKPSSQKRLYVIDVKNNKLLYQTLVAHGHNSGLEYATSFSNEDDSHKSSLGFYVTEGTYNGECGYALKLKGCEKGFNDKAYARSIVVHGSKYVTDAFLHSNGFLGRSWGCPALPQQISKKIIDVIKNGSCLFLYHPTEKYLLTSRILNG
jgi:hypothetical protein